jgi:hypothetical protein
MAAQEKAQEQRVLPKSPAGDLSNNDTRCRINDFADTTAVIAYHHEQPAAFNSPVNGDKNAKTGF